MRLTVLGSGTAVPVPDRFPAGYLVEHVLKKGYAGVKSAGSVAIEIDADSDLGFFGVTRNARGSGSHDSRRSWVAVGSLEPPWGNNRIGYRA